MKTFDDILVKMGQLDSLMYSVESAMIFLGQAGIHMPHPLHTSTLTVIFAILVSTSGSSF